MRLQQPVDRSFGYKILPFVGEAHGQLSRRQLREFQRQIDDLVANVLRDTVPDTIRSGTVVIQRLRPTRTVAVIPAVERGARDAELVQCALGGQTCVSVFLSGRIPCRSYSIRRISTEYSPWCVPSSAGNSSQPSAVNFWTSACRT